jgi:hypothetical protein
VLTQVVERARREALASKEQFTHEEAGREGIFRIAAAGELLRLPDPEDTFGVIQARRRASKSLSLDSIGSTRHRANLRAALWLGATNVKAAERAQLKVLQGLAAAMASHAHEDRCRLRAIIDDASSIEPDTTEESSEPTEDNHREPPRRASGRRLYLSAGAAVVVVAALIYGGVALFDGNKPPGPGPGPTPGGSTSGGVRSASPVAGQGVINQVKACASLPRDSQGALELRSRRQAVVDGRCYPDPNLDVGAQTGLVVTSRPQRISRQDKSSTTSASRAGRTPPTWPGRRRRSGFVSTSTKPSSVCVSDLGPG